MTEQGTSKGRPVPRVIRFVGVFLTVATLLGAMFFLIVAETRDREMSVRRDVAYGELKRIEHALQDISDVSRAKACAEVTEQRAGEAAQELSDESVKVALDAAEASTSSAEGTPADRPKHTENAQSSDASKASVKSCTLESVKLTFEGQQRRDRRTILSTQAITSISEGDVDSDGEDMFRQINERLNGDPDSFALTDIAIVTGDWEFALALRGEAAWPANLGPILETGDPIGWEPKADAARDIRSAQGTEDTKTQKNQPDSSALSLGGPIAINIGGEKVVAHAVPLNIRRVVTVGRTGLKSEGKMCPPRECYLVGIASDEGLMSDISRLSPLTRASFVAAIILLLLLVPMGKLWLIDPRSSMNWPDVAAIIASVPLAIATTFVISLVWAQWLDLQQKFDGDARDIAIELASDADREIKTTNKALLKMVRSPNDSSENQREKQVSKGIENVFAVSKQSSLQYIFDEGQERPAFNYLIRKPPSEGVASRRYFRRAADGDFLTMPLASDKKQDAVKANYVTAVVPSLVEGNSTLVSMIQLESVLKNEEQVEGREWRNKWQIGLAYEAGAAGTEPLDESNTEYILANRQPFFTRHVPLPEGYSFAVLDPETLEVLQHRDVSRAGAERWDERVDDVSGLRAMLKDTMRRCAQSSTQSTMAEQTATGPLTVRYAGRPIRLSASASCGGNWAVLVWYPAEMTQELAITPAALSVALILLIGFVTALAAVVVGMVDKQHLVAIFWPDLRSMQTAVPRSDERRSIGQLDVIAVSIVLLVIFAAQLTLVRGDSAFWQIFAIISAALTIQLGIATAKNNEDWPRSKSLENGVGDEAASDQATVDRDAKRAALKRKILLILSIASILGYAAFSVAVAFAHQFAQTHSQVIYVLLGSLGGAMLFALFSRPLFERLKLSLISQLLKAWFAQNLGLRPSIMRQTLTQGIIVALITVLPSILAYRAASTVIFEQFLAQDVAAVSHAIDQRKRAFEIQCNKLAESDTSTQTDAPPQSSVDTGTNQEACEEFAMGLGAGGVARTASRIKRQAYIEVTANESSTNKPGQPDELVRVLMPHADASRQMLERGLGRSIQRLQPNPFIDLNVAHSATTGRAAGGSGASDPLNRIIRIMLQVAPFVLFGLMGLLGYAYLCKALFGMGLFEFRSLHPRPEFDKAEIDRMSEITPGGPPPLRLYINYPFDKFEQLKNTLEGNGGYNFVDLARLDESELQLASVRTRNRPWIVVGLMRIIGARDLRREALDFLERLLAVEGAQIHFFSEMLPIERLQQVRELERRSHDGDTTQQDINGVDEARHWALLLAQFVTVRWDSFWELRQSRVAKIVDERAEHGQWLNDLIKNEFEAIPNDLVRKQRESFLEELEVKSGEKAGTTKRGRNPTLLYRAYAEDDQPLREQVIEYLANVLSDYYQMKWIGSTREEQILMYHLANGRFVKTTDFRTINGLINRDLIRRDPNLQLMNESFAFWVRTNENPQTFHSYRQMVEQASPWSQLRIPVLVFVVIAAGALAYLDQGTVGSVVSLIPAIAAAIPVFASQVGQSRSVGASS